MNDLQKSYDLMKRNNDFLIGTKEYTEIFRDEEIQNIIKDIEKNKFILFIVWVLFIILFWAVIEFASEYSISKQFIGFIQNQISN